MTAALRQTARPTPHSFGQLFAEVLRWIGTHFWSSITSAVFAGVVGYITNAALMLLYYDGYVKTGSGPATGQGNLINGSLIWAMGSTVFFALWSYRRRVGGKRFWSELRGLPTTAQSLLAADGPQAYVHLLWGAAVALLTMQLVSPWLGGLMAIGVLGMLPSFVTRVLVGFAQNVWSWIAGKFAPTAKEPPGAITMVVGILGSAIALAAGAFLPGSFTSLVMSGVSIGAAYFLMRRNRPGGQAALLLLPAAAALLAALDVLMPGSVLAHDGGLPESGGSIVVWWNSDGSRWLLIHATAGGIASGIGAPIGIAIGDLASIESIDEQYINWLLRSRRSGGGGAGNLQEMPWDESAARPPPQPGPRAPEPPGVTPPGSLPSPQPPQPEVPQNPRDGDVNPRTGEIWSDMSGWSSRENYEADQRIKQQNRAIQERNRTTPTQYDLETRALAHKIATEQAAREAQQAADAKQREDLAAKLNKVYANEGKSTDAVTQALQSGDNAALRDLYKDHLQQMMDSESAKAAAEARYATAMDVGYYASKAILAGAKTGLMVAGGPASAAYTVVGMGLIRGAEDGATTYVETGSVSKTLASTAGGFVAGAKDGAIGRFTNLPGTGTATKILLPAAGDALEGSVRTYIQTGDIGAATKAGLTTAVVSTVAGGAGHLAGGIQNPYVRETSQVVLGGAAGAVSAGVSGGDMGEGFVSGLFDAAGASAGGHAGNWASRSANSVVDLKKNTTPLSGRELQLDQDARANAARAKELVADYNNARTPDERAAATKAILENREAKLLMKGKDIGDSTKEQFASDANKTRTQPLFDKMAERLGGEKTGDGERRFVVIEQDKDNPNLIVDRPVRPDDFQSGSGTAGGAPGQDLDFYSNKRIVDRETGRPVKPDVLEDHVKGACQDLGIDKRLQEINFTHSTHPEAFKIQPGETPAEFIKRAGGLSGVEGQSVTEVNTHKLVEARHNYDNPASALSEQCRTATKDFDRLTKPLLDSHPNARVPDNFRAVDFSTGESALDVMRKVGTGELPAGTGDARFRALTGMGLEEGAFKMASWSEGIVKGGGADSHLIRGSTPREVLQGVVRQALADAQRDGGTQ